MLICVILGLLVLTVIVGLAATLFGCCTVGTVFIENLVTCNSFVPV